MCFILCASYAKVRNNIFVMMISGPNDSIFLLALERREYEGATELHVKMMTKAYDNQSQWLVGMKRLIDLDQKISQ
jgi:hypothetical protein